MFDFDALSGVEEHVVAEAKREKVCLLKERVKVGLAVPTKGRELRICSYNLLAPCYFRTNGGTEADTTFWRPRLESQLRAVFAAADPDILCLQEVWFSPNALEVLLLVAKEQSFQVITCQRRGWAPKDDGIAVLVRCSRLEVLDSEEQELCHEGSRVLLKVFLREKSLGCCFVLGCTHLTYPHDDRSNYLRMIQAHNAGRACIAYGEKQGLGRGDAPLALVGDFNIRSGEDVEGDAALSALLCHRWRSAFVEAYGEEARVTHRTHRGTLICADFILLRGVLKTLSAALLPLSESADADIAQVRLGGAMAWTEKIKPPDSLMAWSQLSDHRPVLATLSLEESVGNG